ncbi:MAG: hypothetical protein OJF51_004108 [Nitrospira sp.]|jgi:hypothetical protein|nr:MAG: hypothetical protein OJF51_004108 [Nitrospira sp.]
MSSNIVSNFTKLNDILLEDRTFFKKHQFETISFRNDDKFLAELADKIESSAENTKLPEMYQDGYFSPLGKNLRGLVETLTARVERAGTYDVSNYVLLTQLVNAALQSSTKNDAYRAVRSLQGFVDDLYKSFTELLRTKVGRKSLDHKIPPLVSFVDYIPLEISNLPPMPGTLELEQLRDLVGELGDDFAAGVVCLPPGYKDRPLLWGIMGHEVMGHYVLTADREDKWLTNLEEAIYQMIKREYPNDVDDQLAALWQFWAEEAASDVCSVLSFGPCAAIGAVSFYTALMPLSNWSKDSKLKAVYQGEENTHPINVLIPALMCGAIDGLDKLSKKSQYISELLDIGTACTEATTVERIEIVDFGLGARVWDPFRKQPPVNLERFMSLKVLQDSAFKVGRFIVTEKFTKLGCPLGSLLSWEDKDQDTANAVARLLPTDLSLTNLDKLGKWEKRHLIAGGLITVMREPALYHSVNEALKRFLSKLN